jgi:hypothetical protein
MDADRMQEIAERDQMWASLRALLPDIGRLAGGGFDPTTDRDRQFVVLLARIVTAELDYRSRDAGQESADG